jgi:hypothetical protein
MEATTLTVRGENAPRLAEALVEAKATESERSINKCGVRNIHQYRGDGFTQLAYERGSSHSNSWLQVSILVETVDDRTATVVVFVGGGGEGPFKLEEITARRIVHGEQSVGQAGRFVTVLRDVKKVCESLDLDVETQYEKETDDLLGTLERKIFHE